ncbi:protein TolQ [Sphingopyxis bauzanensis]|uniref:Protein TolQ n=1 Tax=Sphingopyxis bauzanensis TaxID=651663 RepID=A0A246JY18_9SPHN|nr:protein TolQ [Sphingopyxis bauzanensis]MDP3784410.1 protein TolQ [Sphingopyxis sp.]OWQ97412.1 protein TolQ [Sphingopyxis bauzanensis]GGJ36748.1 Tol-Pal system subunit TolQ [Sphingopyxis bauzanensis]
MLDNISLAADAATLSPVALFLQADIIVKAVMIGLLLASIYVWAVIFTHGRSVSKLMRASENFERDFWRADNIDKFFDKNSGEELPSAKVLAAGISEWRRSTKTKNVDRDGTRERLGIAMNSAVAGEVDRLAEKIGTLATIGSVAPFVGLFGTVWGIMRSFTAIAASNNSSLAVVAPGIAEALFATAIGLFAAIPAVIAYNAFSQRLNRLESRLGRFADGLHATFSRELEVDA